ncbi:4-carboxy-4-hydroxy-2-oxoadipate aldolase/oxaloacetate decarboxylase [Nocardioides sp. cx-173]|uniref:4-carboxy-4-hydroxy-2-oxoadipate aldolase/oxaloacetate decarboxylase n=1 Tax=Nocardioides sp. cx-173 TaxID=2898796 RepID=UPI001E5E956F|nr:4-carboxy-4-hydroxy-2-oxoadipate aldolase/oxaloacetate decarboxylase [Nocardioides sp. cx-173]MCD4526621.1 4-carboxy-4-hydroxy-2-oxoadipate aldolase/oxaloacetate decarboxylase [Nocardioides sp. cx-173]UGB40714.1 4-carboxy-4-hydroxy-2-oxoadipate aldolase/oxaloacetate decarboxylase [Nocardioides sp. cx-173]
MTTTPAAPTDAARLAVTDDQLAELAAVGAATAYEASGLDCALDPAIRPVWKGARLVGRALPVRTHPADNLPLHHAVAQARPGDVLVVDGREELCGYWGEVLAVAAQQRGIAGLVIDGGVRDTVELEELGFPVFSRGVCVRRTGKFWPGSVGDPVTVAGVPVALGDAVVADADGVLVLPPSALAATLSASRARLDAEQEYLTRIRGGELTLDVYGFRE